MSFILFSENLKAQDENSFLQAFRKDNKNIQVQKLGKKYHWKIDRDLYEIDLNGDGQTDFIRIEKRDHEDWLTIFDDQRKKIFERKFPALGSFGYFRKIRLVELTAKLRVLAIFHYQGYLKSPRTLASEKLYLITIEDGLFEKLYFSPIRASFSEREGVRGDYHKRMYRLSFHHGKNKDDPGQLFLGNGHLNYVYSYFGQGNWLESIF